MIASFRSMTNLALGSEDGFEASRVQDPGGDTPGPSPANDSPRRDSDFDSGRIGPGVFSPWPLVAPGTKTAGDGMKVSKGTEKEQQ
jgi:hypothetical protein